MYVSRLRKELGQALLTRPPGYLLRVEPGKLDLDRFEKLAADGRTALAADEPASASEQLSQALSLWRGTALADLAYEPFAQREIARLEEARLACVEERIEADLALGRHGEAVGELESLAAAHPLRERLRGQLMLALYRSGRQAEALETYQVGRRLLSDGLGLDPGEELKGLQKAILAHDQSLDLPVDAPAAHEEAPLPAARPPTTPVPEPVMREVRKTVTVLSAGLTSLHARGERLDPESLRRVTSRASAEIRAVLEGHGGTVETLTGETVTAVFGIPVVHEDDALRAARAAVEMGERLAALADELERNWAARLELRVGVSTGEVVAGGGEGTGLHVTGDPVSAAARLARGAEPGEILVDEATHRLVRDAVLVETAGDARRLVALQPGAPTPRSRFESPMVGRERELRRLHDSFEQAVGDASCQLFTILGAAGVGKSRLVEELLDGLAERALVAGGRCLSYGEGITYWPLVEAIKDAAGLDDAEPPEEGRRKLAALLVGEEEAELVTQRVAELLGLAEAGGSTEESFWAVRTLFEALARKRPLVLVLDDVHWGEATFLDLVEHIADWTRGAPMLLVCLARSELLEIRPGWGGGKLNATSILLEPLSEQESTQLLDNLAGASWLDDEARRRIVEAAEGNPLFVEEMLALAMEDGSAEGELQVPPTIQALLAARLDRLRDGERSVIEAASAEGKVFHEGSVAELMAEGLPSVREHLLALVRKELIRPDRPVFSGERAFRFRHLLIRDAAYESIPKEARATLHERHAGWLEQKAGERAVEYEEIIGYHLEQAFRYREELGPIDEARLALARRAAERLGSAARRAFVRSDASAAVNLISRAAALLPPDDPARVDLIPNVRGVQGMSGDLSWADTVLSDAFRAGDRRLKTHALVQRGFLRLFTEPEVTAEELLQVAENAIEVFGELGDELGLARAWRLMAQAHYLARSGAASAEAAERALVHARRAGDHFEETEIVTWLAVALALGPTPAPQAARQCERLLAEVAGDAVLEVILTAVLAHLTAMQNRLSEAEELFERGRRVMDDLGEVIWLYWLWALLTDAVAGERELEWATELLARIGEKSHFSSTAAVLARATYAQGRYEEAEEHSRASEEAARPNDVHGQITWRSTRAKVLARRGELEAAEELAREAVAFAEESDFLNAHGDSLLDLAEVLELAGRRQEGAPGLEQAIRLYERKGNVVWAAKARARLAELSS